MGYNMPKMPGRTNKLKGGTITLPLEKAHVSEGSNPVFWG
jgi:hypothetical protein